VAQPAEDWWQSAVDWLQLVEDWWQSAEDCWQPVVAKVAQISLVDPKKSPLAWALGWPTEVSKKVFYRRMSARVAEKPAQNHRH